MLKIDTSGEIQCDHKKLIGEDIIEEIEETTRLFREKIRVNAIYELLSSNPLSNLQEFSPDSPRHPAKSNESSDDGMIISSSDLCYNLGNKLM